MATRTICIGPNLDTDQSGALRLSDSAFVENVWNYRDTGFHHSTSFGTSLPGEELTSGHLEATNNASATRTLLVVWSRPYVYLRAAQPNASQVRMKARVESGASLPSPVAPNPTASYDAAFTASTDVGTDGEGTPKFGHYTRAFPGGCWRHVEPVEAGHTVRVSWSVHVWAPPPWSDNASDNNPMQNSYIGPYSVWGAFFPNMEDS